MISSKYVYAIAREGVKLGITFTSVARIAMKIARGTAECYFAVIATTSGSFPKFHSCLTN